MREWDHNVALRDMESCYCIFYKTCTYFQYISYCNFVKFLEWLLGHLLNSLLDFIKPRYSTKVSNPQWTRTLDSMLLMCVSIRWLDWPVVIIFNCLFQLARTAGWLLTFTLYSYYYGLYFYCLLLIITTSMDILWLPWCIHFLKKNWFCKDVLFDMIWLWLAALMVWLPVTYLESGMIFQKLADMQNFFLNES